MLDPRPYVDDTSIVPEGPQRICHMVYPCCGLGVTSRCEALLSSTNLCPSTLLLDLQGGL